MLGPLLEQNTQEHLNILMLTSQTNNALLQIVFLGSKIVECIPV